MCSKYTPKPFVLQFKILFTHFRVKPKPFNFTTKILNDT